MKRASRVSLSPPPALPRRCSRSFASLGVAAGRLARHRPTIHVSLAPFLGRTERALAVVVRLWDRLHLKPFRSHAPRLRIPGGATSISLFPHHTPFERERCDVLQRLRTKQGCVSVRCSRVHVHLSIPKTRPLFHSRDLSLSLALLLSCRRRVQQQQQQEGVNNTREIARLSTSNCAHRRTTKHPASCAARSDSFPTRAHPQRYLSYDTKVLKRI